MPPGNRSSTSKIAVVPLQSESLSSRPAYGPSPVRRMAQRPDEDTIAHYLRLLARGKAILSVAVLVGGALAFFLTRFATPKYRAEMSIEVASLNQDFLNIRSVTPTSAGQPLEPPEINIKTQTVVAQSTPVLERALSKRDLTDRLLATAGAPGPPWTAAARERGDDAEETRRDRAVSMASQALKVKAEPNTRILNLSFESTDPVVAADMANSIAEAAAEMNLERRAQESENTREWFGRQLQEMRDKLAKSDAAAFAYARAAKLDVLSERGNVAEERLRETQVEIGRAHADRIARQSRYELASTATEESLPEVLDDRTLTEYQGQLTGLRRQLADLTSTYTATHPKVVKVEAEIAAVEAALKRSRANILLRIRNEYDAAARRESLLAEDYASQLRALSNQTDKLTQYLLLRREADTNRRLYDSMVQRFAEADLASAMRANEIRVIQPARPPEAPFKPKAPLNIAFGMFSGLLFAAAFVLHREKNVRGVDTARETVLDLNVQELGVIPAAFSNTSGLRRIIGRSSNSLDHSAGALELTTWKQWPQIMAESFRQTLISIMRSEVNDGRRPVIAISSADKGEGKTTVLSNLGIALAQIDCEVLLIDANMREPRLHEIFGVDNSVGFGDALAGNDFVSGRRTTIQRLNVLPCGKHRDERLLFSIRMEEVLRRFRDQYDIILIDTPSVLQHSDARLVGIHADAVILVVAPGTDRNALLLAQKRFEEDGSRLLGAIVNCWEPRNARPV